MRYVKYAAAEKWQVHRQDGANASKRSHLVIPLCQVTKDVCDRLEADGRIKLLKQLVQELNQAGNSSRWSKKVGGEERE